MSAHGRMSSTATRQCLQRAEKYHLMTERRFRQLLRDFPQLLQPAKLVTQTLHLTLLRAGSTKEACAVCTFSCSRSSCRRRTCHNPQETQANPSEAYTVAAAIAMDLLGWEPLREAARDEAGGRAVHTSRRQCSKKLSCK